MIRRPPAYVGLCGGLTRMAKLIFPTRRFAVSPLSVSPVFARASLLVLLVGEAG